MSPNEEQLRAALHDGEGDVPDAHVVIAGVVSARQERRRRITSIASAAAVVAVIAVGGTLLIRNQSADEASDDSAGGGAIAASSTHAPAYNSLGALPRSEQATHGGNTSNAAPTGSSDQQKAFDIPCPGTFPKQLLPGGGGTNQFGADEPLFPTPVAAMKVCAFGPLQGSTTVTGSTAQSFATALNDAAGTDSASTCARFGTEYALYAVSATEQRLRVVTATTECSGYLVTNGTAVRHVPSAEFDALRVAMDAAPSPKQGSPIK